MVRVLSLETVFPASDGVALEIISYREAVRSSHQYGVVRGAGQQGHPTDVTPAVLEGTQPRILSLHDLNKELQNF